MKTTIFIALSFLFVHTLPLISATQNTSNTLNGPDWNYNPKTNLVGGGDFRSSLRYAEFLYATGSEQSYSRADSIVNKVVSCQVYDESSANYGVWAWSAGGRIGDKNVPLFLARYMMVGLWEHQDKMSFETRAAFTLSCKRLVEAAERRYDEEVWAVGRSDVAYSNIYALYVETLTIAAERFNDARLKRKAKVQWTRFYNNFLFHGLDEFLSSNYDNVIFNALLTINVFCNDDRQQKEVKEMMDYVYLAESAVTHPLLKLPVVGISRDYREFQHSGDVRVGFLKNPPEKYIPPAQATRLNTNRHYPFEVLGKAGAMPFVYKSYQLPNVAMGSMTGWGNYYWQQIHCMAAAGNNENERATLFVPGSYTPINGFTDQKELSTLCIYNRLPTLWHLTQWRQDIADIWDTFVDFGVGISDNLTLIAQDEEKVILRAFGYDFYLFPFQLENGHIRSCELILKQRTETSPRYHRRKADFREFVFPEEPEWFGVFIKVVKAGEKARKPVIRYKKEDKVQSFATNAGHIVKVAITEQGTSVHIHRKDLNLMPRINIKE